tara:strand:+ start:4138 stop:4884 length:747 start_codon:yes stop_codon:yes gene_type:complete
MKNLAAVFWDVDGTIADTELCGHRVAFNKAFREARINWFWDEKTYIDLLKISGGLNRIKFYRDYINDEISDFECIKIQMKKRVHYENLIKLGKIRPREGVLRLIEELASNSVRQFIVTTSGRKSLEPLINSVLNHYSKYFSDYITYEDVDRHKPYPDAYELAIRRSKHNPSNCLAIEDSDVGVKAAKSAKLRCLLTLPTWNSFNINPVENANSCVDTLGSLDMPSKLYYGKPLLGKLINIEYLTNIIN